MARTDGSIGHCEEVTFGEAAAEVFGPLQFPAVDVHGDDSKHPGRPF